MRRIRDSAFVFLLAFFTCPVFAQDDSVLKAMKDEMNRTVSKLRLDNLKKPYFVSYYVVDSTSYYVSSFFGDIVSEETSVNRYGKVDVRVGKKQFDNSHYIGSSFSDYSPFSGNLPVEDDYDAVRNALWLLSDGAYKDALEKYSQKDSYRKKRNIKEIYGDLNDEVPVVYIEKTPVFKWPKADWLKKNLNSISALARDYPAIQSMRVSAVCRLLTRRFVNSEQAEYRIFFSEVSVTESVQTQNNRGYPIFGSKSFVYQNPSEIDFAEIRKGLKELAGDCSRAVEPAKLDFYIGPAIFEGKAAMKFFNQLFIRNVSFSPLPWAEKDSYLKYYYEIPKLVERIGMRVFPPFISVYDAPLQKRYKGRFLLGYYPLDAEGVIPGKVELVRRGKLKNIYLSRHPQKNFSRSNGHGRMTAASFPVASAGNVFIESEKTVSRKKLRQELAELGRELELEYVVVIKDVKKYKSNSKYMGDPVSAYKIDLKTMEETPLGVMEFEGLTLRALRDIIMTDSKQEVCNFYQSGPYTYSNGRYPTSIISPGAVLVREIELRKTNKKPDKLPYLKHPYLEK